MPAGEHPGDGPAPASRAATRRAVFVIGTRAQLIKVAPVVLAYERRGRACLLLMTGQHRETMQDLVTEFGIASPQSEAVDAAEHATVNSLVKWLPKAVSSVTAHLRALAAEGPIDVLVHGDTLSTLVGAYAGRRAHARVVHLESGLRSQRLLDPFPEEICRRIVFRLADVAMCPNDQSMAVMSRYRKVVALHTHGNTILDAVRATGALDRVGQGASSHRIVASLHRFQNLYSHQRLESLVGMLEAIAADLEVSFVLHPATRNKLSATGLMDRLRAVPTIDLVPRMGYRDFLHLVAGSACVLTDGGSNQEELASLGVPTIVMRATTERPDGIGANAIMEADLGMDVATYVRGRRFEVLRRHVDPRRGTSPSDAIVEALTTGVLPVPRR